VCVGVVCVCGVCVCVVCVCVCVGVCVWAGVCVGVCVFFKKPGHCNPCFTTHFTPQLRILLPKSIYINIADALDSQLISGLEVSRPNFVGTSVVLVLITCSAYFIRYLITLLDEGIILLLMSNFISSLLFCLSWTKMFLSKPVYMCPQS